MAGLWDHVKDLLARIERLEQALLPKSATPPAKSKAEKSK